MSTTAFEIKGPNKALFRTAAIAGSAIIWGALGYVALTFVPKMDKPFTYDGPIIDTVRPVKPKIEVPPPLPKPPEIVKDRPITLTPSPEPTKSTLTVRDAISANPNPLAGEFPAGPAPLAPSTFGTEPALPGPSGWVEPDIIVKVPELPPIIPVEPVVPPAPKLTINPVRMAGANPTFPRRAMEAGLSGEVTMSFTVTPLGKVENIDITGERPSGYGFGRAAREAIQGWTFQPQTIDGVAVAYPARYTISFKLED